MELYWNEDLLFLHSCGFVQEIVDMQPNFSISASILASLESGQSRPAAAAKSSASPCLPTPSPTAAESKGKGKNKGSPPPFVGGQESQEILEESPVAEAVPERGRGRGGGRGRKGRGRKGRGRGATAQDPDGEGHGGKAPASKGKGRGRGATSPQRGKGAASPGGFGIVSVCFFRLVFGVNLFHSFSPLSFYQSECPCCCTG